MGGVGRSARTDFGERQLQAAEGLAAEVSREHVVLEPVDPVAQLLAQVLLHHARGAGRHGRRARLLPGLQGSAETAQELATERQIVVTAVAAPGRALGASFDRRGWFKPFGDRCNSSFTSVIPKGRGRKRTLRGYAVPLVIIVSRARVTHS